ncbi:hypothetical protein FQR65_LT12966 [Abscondita terminalis]|nr:hypothetical protein FQR65_LT12966 [Abscondita terminalis]
MLSVLTGFFKPQLLAFVPINNLLIIYSKTRYCDANPLDAQQKRQATSPRHTISSRSIGNIDMTKCVEDSSCNTVSNSRETLALYQTPRLTSLMLKKKRPDKDMISGTPYKYALERSLSEQKTKNRQKRHFEIETRESSRSTEENEELVLDDKPGMYCDIGVEVADCLLCHEDRASKHTDKKDIFVISVSMANFILLL